MSYCCLESSILQANTDKLLFDFSRALKAGFVKVNDVSELPLNWEDLLISQIDTLSQIQLEPTRTRNLYVIRTFNPPYILVALTRLQFVLEIL